MPDRTRHDEQLLDLPEDETFGGEHLDSQVQKAQEQIFALKRQQEQIERQKRELEELSRRQEQLHTGRTEMVEKFTRALVVLERETYDAQKRLELLNSVTNGFNQHLDVLEGINPKSWDGLDLNKELTRSLSAIDDARSEYGRSLPKISPAADGETDSAAAAAGYQADFSTNDQKDFVYWLKAGLAFTAPLVMVGLALIYVILSALP